MVGTILPIVHRERQQGKSWSALWFHVAGCLVGAACLGSLLGTIGSFILWPALPIGRNSAVLAASGLVGLLYSIRELGLFQVPVLQATRQVPELWRHVLPPQVASLLYGLGLGFGLATRIPVGTFYVAVIWSILVGNPLLGAVGMAAFGLGRALPLMWMAWSFNSNEQTFRLMRILPRWQPVVHLVNGVALGFAGSSLLVAGVILN